MGGVGILMYRRVNNSVSRYPSYQKIFGLTENFEWNYRSFVAKMNFLKKLPLFWNENLVYVKIMLFWEKGLQPDNFIFALIFCQDTNFQKKICHSTSYFIQFSLNIPIPQCSGLYFWMFPVKKKNFCNKM